MASRFLSAWIASTGSWFGLGSTESGTGLAKAPASVEKSRMRDFQGALPMQQYPVAVFDQCLPAQRLYAELRGVHVMRVQQTLNRFNCVVENIQQAPVLLRELGMRPPGPVFFEALDVESGNR